MSAPERHPFDDDPLSGSAQATFNVGRRTLVALTDGFLQIPRTFLGTIENPAAGDEVLRSVYGQSRLPLGCFLFPGPPNVLVDTGFAPRKSLVSSPAVGCSITLLGTAFVPKMWISLP